VEAAEQRKVFNVKAGEQAWHGAELLIRCIYVAEKQPID